MSGWTPTGRVVRGKYVFTPSGSTPSVSYLWQVGRTVEIGVRKRLELVASRKRYKEQSAIYSAIMFSGVFIPPNFKAWWWEV